ncbi:Cytochrome f [Capsicum chinense]|nr:Cytochrome f [Capsicum chinense]
MPSTVSLLFPNTSDFNYPATKKDVHFSKYPLYIGGNRRRGQIYPNGSKIKNTVSNSIAPVLVWLYTLLSLHSVAFLVLDLFPTCLGFIDRGRPGPSQFGNDHHRQGPGSGRDSTITRKPAASTSQPMDNNATNVILAYLDTMSRDLAMANERLDRMIGQKGKVGCLDTCQEEGCSSCELQGKNVIPYTPMNFECCVVDSRSQVGLVAALPRVEVLESPFCDTLSIVRSHEKQTLVVGTQALADPFDDEIDSPRENDLCPSSASTYNLIKVPLPSDESIHTLVDPCENQGGPTLVYELSTTSEVVDNDQSGGNNLDVPDCLGNLNYVKMVLFLIPLLPMIVYVYVETTLLKEKVLRA